MADTPPISFSQESSDRAALDQPPTPIIAGGESPSDARGSIRRESPSIQTQTENAMGPQLDFLWRVHSYVNDYIRFADTKAGFAVTLAGGLLGLLYSAKAWDLFIKVPYGKWSWLSWLALTSFALLVLTILLGVWAIRPRLWSHGHQGFIYWGGVARFPTPDAFHAEFRKQADGELLKHLAHHVFELSRICDRKYCWVSRCIIAGVVGGVAAGWLLIVEGR